jgi:hypothetical protein
VESAEEYFDSYDAMFPESGKQLHIPTPFYLYEFSHPFIAWVFGIAGIIVLGVVKRAQRAGSLGPAGQNADAAGKMGCRA